MVIHDCIYKLCFCEVLYRRTYSNIALARHKFQRMQWHEQNEHVVEMNEGGPYDPVGNHYQGAAVAAQNEQRAFGTWNPASSGPTFILIILFYDVENETRPVYSLFARLLTWYERVTGKAKHRHVGFNIGTLDARGQVTMLPYDISCFNSRSSGINLLDVLDRDLQKQRKNCVVCSDALYVEISAEFVDQVLGNFKHRNHAYKGNSLPTKNIPYPSQKTIIHDYFYFIFYFSLFRCGRACTLAQKDEELQRLSARSQCTQYVLWLILRFSEQQTSISISGDFKQSLFRLLLRRASLHPHSLWGVLTKYPVFKTMPHSTRIKLIQQDTIMNKSTPVFVTKLDNIFMQDPYNMNTPLNESIVEAMKLSSFAHH